MTGGWRQQHVIYIAAATQKESDKVTSLKQNPLPGSKFDVAACIHISTLMSILADNLLTSVVMPFNLRDALARG